MTDNNVIISIDNMDDDAAYERVLPEAQALAADQLAPVNVDITSAFITVQGVAKRLPAMQQDLQTLAHLPADAVGQFQDYVLAVYSAQQRYSFATTPPEQLPALLDEATKWRDIFIADARTQVTRGQLSANAMKGLTGSHGYKNVAFDLGGLCQLFNANWSTLHDKTTITEDEVKTAHKLAFRLATAVAYREQSPEQIAAAADIRQRIFTLLYNAYDEIRRAVHFLRWHEGDADTIAPSLYAGRGNSNAAHKNGSGANPSAPAAPTAPPAVAAPAVTASSAEKVPVGLPGSDPLMPA